MQTIAILAISFLTYILPMTFFCFMTEVDKREQIGLFIWFIVIPACIILLSSQ